MFIKVRFVAFPAMMKFSWAISWVKWLSSEQTAQSFDPADSPRELHHVY
jgi:hypothetical protein